MASTPPVDAIPGTGALRGRERCVGQEGCGVQHLYPGRVVPVERGDRPGTLPEAEVVTGRVGEPHADVVEVDPLALAVDQRGGERLLDDQRELLVRPALPVGG